MVRKAVKVVKKKTTAKKKTTKKSAVKDTSKLEHFLVPEHVKLSEKEKEVLFNKYNITIKELPKIFINDPAIRHLDLKTNDVVKIIRKSPTAGNVSFFRGVIDE